METFITILTIFFCAVCTLGIIGNSIMMIAFLRSRVLRYTCHHLIFAHCCVLVLHLTGEIPLLITVFTNLAMTQALCFYIDIFAIIGGTATSPLYLVLGLERLAAITVPHWYRTHYKTRFVTMSACILPTVVCLYIIVIGFVNQSEKEIEICMLPTALNGVAIQHYIYSTLFLNVLIIAIYGSLAYLIRKRGIFEREFEPNIQAITKTIVTTVAVIFLGWVATMLFNVFIYIFLEEGPEQRILIISSGIFVFVAEASNIFVYYFTNEQYRKEIRRLFCKPTSDITPLDSRF